MARGVLCCTHHVNGMIAGAAGGFATIFEKKERRIELALYICMFSMRALYRLLKLPNPRGGTGLLFATSLAVIIMAFCSGKDHLLRPQVKGGIRFLLGLNLGDSDGVD